MSLVPLEKRGNKAIVHVNIYPAKQCTAYTYETGYVAIASEMTMCWSHAETIDCVIEKFQKEYGGLLSLKFQNGEQLEFDFSVKLKG